jgi:hypothetical protein
MVICAIAFPPSAADDDDAVVVHGLASGKIVPRSGTSHRRVHAAK